MLMELAIGDAYGAGFEYAPLQFVQENNDGKHYHQHPKHKIKPGCYTDDTQMSIAVAELIVEGVEFSRLEWANRFVEAFKRDERVGYAKEFYNFLRNINNGADLLEKIKPYSDKSGAAMRACPIGVLPDVRSAQTLATLQAQLTHNTPGGIISACGAALLTHYAIYQLGPAQEAGKWLESLYPKAFDVPWGKNVSSPGRVSVSAAITAFCRNNRMSDLLKDCIAFSGDVDTVATIALAAASCSAEYDQDLPQSLYNKLESGPYGSKYLEDLDEKLMAVAEKFS